MYGCAYYWVGVRTYLLLVYGRVLLLGGCTDVPAISVRTCLPLGGCKDVPTTSVRTCLLLTVTMALAAGAGIHVHRAALAPLGGSDSRVIMRNHAGLIIRH